MLDIRFSANCNMRCRMCNPFNSSEIYKEFKKSREHFNQRNVCSDWSGADSAYANAWPKWNVDELVEFCTPLEQIVISGGEPFLHPEFYELIDRLVEKSLAPKIQIQITN